MGGKKKSKKAEPKKRGPKLAIAFTCPSCNADRAVTCKLKYEADLVFKNLVYRSFCHPQICIPTAKLFNLLNIKM